MSYQVRVTREALGDINAAAAWYADRAPDVGRIWQGGLWPVIDSLAENPERCGLAHETEKLPFELRELLYGSGRRKTHRILFRILEDQVEILAVQHASQQDYSPREIDTTDSDD